jgi:hypothetical protein
MATSGIPLWSWAGSPPTLLPVAMESLLRTVRIGLEDAQNFTDGTDGALTYE